jgi:SAM-dependent methyltransferase
MTAAASPTTATAVAIRCPVCQGTDCRSLGPIRHYQPTIIGSVAVDLSDLTFRLMQCATCRFQFSDPRIPPEKLLQCYSATDAEHWCIDVDPRERRYELIKELLVRHSPGRRVMDVGCSTASLLHYLGPEWDRFGVEPSVTASGVARKRGINILGATFDDIPKDIPAFDAIIAVDVIEHINEPIPFITQARNLLRPGGVLILVTGDTASPSWRLMKGRYWYCSYAGHVSYFSAATFAVIADELDMCCIENRRLPHIRSRFLRHVKMAAMNLAYTLGVVTGGLGIPAIRRKTVDSPGPSWVTAPDHIFQVMRRN